MKTASILRLPCCAAMVLAALGAAAYASPPNAGSILRQEQPAPRAIERLPADRSASQRPALSDTGAVKVRISSIHFSGIKGLVTEAELGGEVQDAIGREVDFDGLTQLAERITGYLKRRGWLLARAYLP